MSDITLAYEEMLHAYQHVFSSKSARMHYCPIKSVLNIKRVHGVSVERRTVLPAKTLDDVCGEKVIYVNDETGKYTETVRVGGVTYENKGITTFRCGIMTCVAISLFASRMNISFDNVGFIGCGRTNLQNCKAIHEIFHIGTAVIRGSYKNRAKNIDKFSEVVNTIVDDTNDLSVLNKCDVVVVCTSNYCKEHMISSNDLYAPRLIIVLDCGYTLDESFRANADNFTDYTEQICSHYEDEFPFDSKRYKMRQMVEDKSKVKDRVCVYMHGIGFADVTIAKMICEGKISC